MMRRRRDEWVFLYVRYSYWIILTANRCMQRCRLICMPLTAATPISVWTASMLTAGSAKALPGNGEYASR